MIKIDNIKKSYNGELVLKGISLEINDGDFISIMGRSGSGKTTLLSILGGFLTPDSGTVLIDDKDIYKLNDKEMAYFRSNDAGFVFQHFKLISTLDVKDNILLPSSLSSKNKEIINKNFDYYTSKLNINTLLNKYPDELSGGQNQRVAIGRSLIYEPKIIFLDEPTGALDSENEKIVMELLKDLNKTKNTTIIMVTHSEKVAAYSKKIIRVLDGEIKEN